MHILKIKTINVSFKFAWLVIFPFKAWVDRLFLKGARQYTFTLLRPDSCSYSTAILAKAAVQTRKWKSREGWVPIKLNLKTQVTDKICPSDQSLPTRFKPRSTKRWVLFKVCYGISWNSLKVSYLSHMSKE